MAKLLGSLKEEARTVRFSKLINETIRISKELGQHRKSL